MPKLSTADYAQLLSSMGILNSGVDPCTLPERTISAVLSLIPNEMTAFDGFNRDTGYQNSYWYSPPGTVSEDQVGVLAELIHEHPYYVEGVSTQGQAVFRVSDYLPLKKFHKLAVYNEFYRDFAGEAQITCVMSIAPKSVVTCSLLRPTLDFSDRELRLLDLLTPHLAAAFRNAQAFERLESKCKFLTFAVERGIVVVDTRGHFVFVNDIAEKLLQIYFGDFVADNLPEALQRYMEHEGFILADKNYHAPVDPFRVRRQGSALLIRAAFDNVARQLTLIFEERADRSEHDFCSLGLTARESEVLFWIGKGKTDWEIALMCSISPRTVQKHVENMFVKLGVETRTAAVSVATEKVESGNNVRRK